MPQSISEKSNRIQELDVLRGLAIFGIFMVNILVMNICFVHRHSWEFEQVGFVNQATLFLLENLFYSKFFPLFSFLFGIGIALQIHHMKKLGTYKTSFFLRRLGMLLLFGISHILFLWSGDILHLYAVLGTALLFLFRLPAKIILVLAILVFIFPFYSHIYVFFIELFSLNPERYLAQFSSEEIVTLKHQGSYFSGIQLRIGEWAFASNLIYAGIAPVAFAMMLLGGFLVKTQRIFDLNSFTKKITKPFLITFLLSLIFRYAIIYWIVPTFHIAWGSPFSIALYTIFQFSDIIVCLFYVWGIICLYQNDYFRRLLSPLRYVGKMALSNYIFQSLLGYIIMRTLNGYGEFTVASCVLIVIASFILQLILSKLWLRFYRFGPLEWLWRCISYGTRFPIKRSNHAE